MNYLRKRFIIFVGIFLTLMVMFPSTFSQQSARCPAGTLLTRQNLKSEETTYSDGNTCYFNATCFKQTDGNYTCCYTKKDDAPAIGPSLGGWANNIKKGGVKVTVTDDNDPNPIVSISGVSCLSFQRVGNTYYCFFSSDSNPRWVTVTAQESVSDPCGNKKTTQTNVVVSTNERILSINNLQEELRCIYNGSIWFFNLGGGFDGNTPQCCGDQNSDNFVTYDSRERIMLCHKCNISTNNPSETTQYLFGNGFQVGDICYVGAPVCKATNISHGGSIKLPGGGNRDYFFDSSTKMCYYNIFCGPGSCGCSGCNVSGQYNKQEECTSTKIENGTCYYNGLCTREGCVYSKNAEPSAPNDVFYQEILVNDLPYLRVSARVFDPDGDKLKLLVCTISSCENVLCNSSKVNSGDLAFCDIPLSKLCSYSKEVELYVMAKEEEHAYPCNNSKVNKKQGNFLKLSYFCKRIYAGYTYVYLKGSIEDKNNLTKLYVYFNNIYAPQEKFTFEYDLTTSTNFTTPNHPFFEIDMERTKIEFLKNIEKNNMLYFSIAVKIKNERKIDFTDYFVNLGVQDKYFNKVNYPLGLWRLDFTNPKGFLENCYFDGNKVLCETKLFEDEHSDVKSVREQITFSKIMPNNVCDIFSSWRTNKDGLINSIIPGCFEIRYVIRDLADNYYFVRTNVTYKLNVLS